MVLGPTLPGLPHQRFPHQFGGTTTLYPSTPNYWDVNGFGSISAQDAFHLANPNLSLRELLDQMEAALQAELAFKAKQNQVKPPLFQAPKPARHRSNPANQNPFQVNHQAPNNRPVLPNLQHYQPVQPKPVAHKPAKRVSSAKPVQQKHQQFKVSNPHKPQVRFNLPKPSTSHAAVQGMHTPKGLLGKYQLQLLPNGILKAYGGPRSPKNMVRVDGKLLSGARLLKNGSILQLGKNDAALYFNEGQLHKLTPEKASLLRKLFPNGLHSVDFRQGHVQDCTFLSSLKAVLHKNPAKLIEMFEPGPNGKVRIHFRSVVGQSSTHDLAMSQLQPNGVRGPLGVQLLESAFGEHLKMVNQAGSVASALRKGGYGEQSLKALGAKQKLVHIHNSGNALGRRPATMGRTLEILKQIEANPKNTVAIISTCERPIGDHRLKKNHAYAVLKVDSGKRLLTIADPHNSSHAFEISYQKLFYGFRRVLMARI